MSRPPFEVADIIRSAGDAFREQYGSSLTWPQHKVLDAIVRCRTAALGGHRDQCLSCGREAISYCQSPSSLHGKQLFVCCVSAVTLALRASKPISTVPRPSLVTFRQTASLR